MNDTVVMLQTKNLVKTFGARTVLRDLNLTVKQGEFVMLLGPNGAGKTTLLRILAMLMRPTGGKVELAGIPSDKAKPSIRELIGVISHQTFLYEDLNAYENLNFYGQLYGVANPKQRVNQVLEIVGLTNRAQDRVRTYSRGMQQRLSIARAILHDPPILLLDEPDTGLDRQASDMLSNLIRAMAIDGTSRTVLMTTHNLERGLAMCNRVIVLANGKLVQDVPADSLSASSLPQFYYTAVNTRK
jgi:heme exporter protein A